MRQQVRWCHKERWRFCGFTVFCRTATLEIWALSLSFAYHTVHAHWRSVAICFCQMEVFLLFIFRQQVRAFSLKLISPSLPLPPEIITINLWRNLQHSISFKRAFWILKPLSVFTLLSYRIVQNWLLKLHILKQLGEGGRRRKAFLSPGTPLCKQHPL